MVIIGIIAFERACFITTTFSLNPFALAVVTYSSFRESIILERVIRLRIEDSAAPKVIDGRIIWLIPPLPATGSQPSIMENKIIRRGPSQKLGIEMPRSDKNIEPLSNIEYCLYAAIMPRGMEIITAVRIAQSVSSNVAGNLSKIVAKTGF